VVEIDREDLQRALVTAAPALASSGIVAVLSHFCFRAGTVLAYNGAQAIEADCPDLGAAFALQGSTLLKMVNSLDTSKMAVTDKTDHVLFKSGRSNLKLSALREDDFVAPFPDTSSADVHFKVTEDFLEGLRTCLVSVTDDASNPAMLGITFVADDSEAALYSTDRKTITRFELTEFEDELPAGAPIILPTFFCQNLLSMAAKSDGAIVFYLVDDALVAEFENGRLFTKLLSDADPIDYRGVISGYVDLDNMDEALTVPTTLEAAIGRALVLYESDADKVTAVSITGSSMQLNSSTEGGQMKDTVKLADDTFGDVETNVDPTLWGRALKNLSEFHVAETLTVFSTGGTKVVHLVAAVSS
jgi:DNA polymerase III sliding clamp (beta) subunit (PCNA family)